MDVLCLTSCQAPNADETVRAMAGYLAQRLQMPTEFVADIPWQERERRLDAGEVHMGWICGLPYVRKADRPRPTLELLAAPVMSGQRYEGRPVYFSDVVVRRDSPFRSFADLRGAAWAYNEPGSHSGYNVVRYHLATLGEYEGYFGRVVQSGAHQISLRLILRGEVDASAIDSTVLETELRRFPHIGQQIRIIATLGPSPIPPWTVQRSLPPAFRERLRHALLTMHEDAGGRAILAEAEIARFTAVTDRDYDPIREMARLAERVGP